MEQNEKIEKPVWVERVESLPEIVRQQVGTTCAGCISTLIQIGLISSDLLFAVIKEAKETVSSYFSNGSAE